MSKPSNKKAICRAARRRPRRGLRPFISMRRDLLSARPFRTRLPRPERRATDTYDLPFRRPLELHHVPHRQFSPSYVGSLSGDPVVSAPWAAINSCALFGDIIRICTLSSSTSFWQTTSPSLDSRRSPPVMLRSKSRQVRDYLRDLFQAVNVVDEHALVLHIATKDAAKPAFDRPRWSTIDDLSRES